MSYARFSEGDVYVFGIGDGQIECQCCLLVPSDNPRNLMGYDSFIAEDATAMLAHLREHQRRRHEVPEDAIERLIEEGAVESRSGSGPTTEGNDG